MNFRDSLVSLLKNQLVEPPSFGAEVGVHRGRTSLRLLLEFPLLHLYLVDKWGNPSDSYVESGDPIARNSDVEQEGFYKETVKQIHSFVLRAEILRMDSVQATEFMQKLSFAFIDADHSYFGCSRDIRAYWPMIRAGGVLCGHDYGKSDTIGVSEAVDEFAENEKLLVHTEPGNIWWVRK